MSVIENSKLATARGVRLAETLREVQAYAKRAKDPADRVAFAEIEQELLNIRTRWLREGLIDQASQQSLAMPRV